MQGNITRRPQEKHGKYATLMQMFAAKLLTAKQ
jgi:hypothetical protein